MNKTRDFCVVVFAIVAITSAFTQTQNTNTNEVQQRKVTTTAKPADPKISPENRERALQLLELSEAQARSFEAPLRSYMLYQIAQAYLQVDKTKSSGLLRDAFTSTLDIRDEDDLKQRLQDSILTGLLPLSQADVEELMQQAEPQARKRASVAIAQGYLSAKRFDRAIALVTQMSSWTELPYDIASQIMAALPEEMDGDFRTLFTQAFSSFQSHSHKGVLQSGGDFSALVAKFGNRLPPRMTLDAIDEVLKQAKEHDNASISLSGEGGTASFGSVYEYQLFQLLPLIRKLDEGHAKALLDQNTLVKSMAQQFPNGVQSLDPGSADTGKPNANGANAQDVKPVRSRLSVGISTGSKGREVSAEDSMRMELGRRAEQIAKDSENAPLQAIAQALSLPTTPEWSPRARALAGIVQSNVKKNPTAAKQCLDELRKTAKDLIPQNQVRYLVDAAKAYLELGETDAAQKTLEDGFKLSEKMLLTDKDAEDPNKALKAYWPSVDSYRQFLEIETRISQIDAQKMLDDIQDPEMQTIQRVMFTNVLLGKPMKTSIVSRKKKSGNFMSISNSD